MSSILGLPEELGIHDDFARSEQRVSIRTEKRRYGKTVTIVEGVDASLVDLDELASELKSKLATGGTVSEGRIELQGDHVDRVSELLEEQGFRVD
ncbi:MAG: translation initiation factor [Halobacteria archaeon]|nr:translation initiation factor [Halobacteria archaeon]